MQLLLNLILITSTWTLGLTIASQGGGEENMILYPLRQWADKKYKQGHKWVEPLIRCFWCMPSFHSLIAYAFAVGIGLITKFSLNLIAMWPLVVCGASILNGIVWLLITLIMRSIEFYDNFPKDDPNLQEDGETEEPKEVYHTYTKN